MRTSLLYLSALSILSFSLLGFSYNVTEYNRAMKYLEDRGEVYYKFCVNSPSELRPLQEHISIDKINHTEVFAYANKEGFNKFLEHNLYYEVLTPPSLLIDPVMSDYSGPGPFQWDRYPTYDGFCNIIKKFETDYPDFVKVYEIGPTTKDRTVFAIKLTDNVNENEAEPKFLQSATIHGDETLNFMNMFRMIDYLLTNYGENDFATRMIDSVEMWIIPAINPDGTYRQGNSSVQGATRYNPNNVDLNRDFPDPVIGMYPHGKWERETRTLVEWERDFHFELQIDWHGGIESALWPWACWSRKHADDPWYRMISEEYADLAQENSISGYFTWKGGSGNCYADWGEIHGTRIDYQPYYCHGPGVTIETSTRKLLSESQLENYWNYNFKAMQNYYSEIFYGIRGTVTDSITGEGVAAKIFVENHDKDSSWRYTNMPHGDYYRLIYMGRYSLTFTAEDYHPKTVSNIEVKNKKATILNVKLMPTNTVVKSQFPDLALANAGITVIPASGRYKIINNNMNEKVTIDVYKPNGVSIISRTIQPRGGNNVLVWEGKNQKGEICGNGYYIISIQKGNSRFYKRVTYVR